MIIRVTSLNCRACLLAAFIAGISLVAALSGFASSTPITYPFGNAVYVDMAVGDTYNYLGKAVTLVELDGNFAVVRVGRTEARLIKIVRALPATLEGVRVFVADNRHTKALTTDSAVHGLLQRDALICLSDGSRPLLDPDHYTFPIGREDGYNWHMEEASGMFSYYGEPWRKRETEYYRSHEGIDFNMHDGRGIEKHPLVAIEDGTVRWVRDTNADEACILIESAANKSIFYVYQHMCNRLYYVKDGQQVKKGDKLGYIWGDGVWGHLHLSIVHRNEVPQYEDRYTNTLNFFPQMYELWHGDLALRPKVWTQGSFSFGHEKSEVENILRFAEYDDLVGYGWLIGDWCIAASVQRHPRNVGSIQLNKVLHRRTPAEALNPEDYYDFAVTVEPGEYRVSARVGDVLAPTWQEVSINGISAGILELDPNTFGWTDEVLVQAPEGRLVLRLRLRDSSTPAGISQLNFTRVDGVQAKSAAASIQ